MSRPGPDSGGGGDVGRAGVENRGEEGGRQGLFSGHIWPWTARQRAKLEAPSFVREGIPPGWETGTFWLSCTLCPLFSRSLQAHPAGGWGPGAGLCFAEALLLAPTPQLLTAARG